MDNLKKVNGSVKRTASKIRIPELEPSPSKGDLEKLNQIIVRLKADMELLSQEIKHDHQNKLNDLNEVQKLQTELKMALDSTENLRSALHAQEKVLNEFAKNVRDSNDDSVANQSKIEELLKTMEDLESMVQNICEKY